MLFEFVVYDSDPADSHTWGAVRVEASSEDEARDKVNVALQEEIAPKGTLVPPYTLEVISGL